MDTYQIKKRLQGHLASGNWGLLFFYFDALSVQKTFNSEKLTFHIPHDHDHNDKLSD